MGTIRSITRRGGDLRLGVCLDPHMIIAIIDPTNISFDSLNKYFAGWPKRCIGLNSHTGMLLDYNAILSL